MNYGEIEDESPSQKHKKSPSPGNTYGGTTQADTMQKTSSMNKYNNSRQEQRASDFNEEEEEQQYEQSQQEES